MQEQIPKRYPKHSKRSPKQKVQKHDESKAPQQVHIPPTRNQLQLPKPKVNFHGIRGWQRRLIDKPHCRSSNQQNCKSQAAFKYCLWLFHGCRDSYYCHNLSQSCRFYCPDSNMLLGNHLLQVWPMVYPGHQPHIQPLHVRLHDLWEEVVPLWKFTENWERPSAKSSWRLQIRCGCKIWFTLSRQYNHPRIAQLLKESSNATRPLLSHAEISCKFE